MPSVKTHSTELSVGFGILLQPPLQTQKEKAQNLFNGSLSEKDFLEYLEEYRSKETYYRRFYAIGLHLRYSFRSFHGVTRVTWEGPKRQAGTISIPKDLVVADIPVSVKDSSNIVGNPSPYGLFVSLPQGHSYPSRSKNWYLEVAPQEYQTLYEFVRDVTESYDYPHLVSDYHRLVKGKTQKKKFSHKLVGLSSSDQSIFQQLYSSLNHAVARTSANLFNQYFSSSLNSNIRIPVTERIMRQFFRLGDSSYILCGIDRGKNFALYIPDLTTWKKEWKLRSILATPDLTREQSQVKISIVLAKGREEFPFEFHTEVRWSHGKFVGNPEAKIYKEFSWPQVPFLNSLLDESTVTKIQILGEGTYGVVYEAFDGKIQDRIALKEFRVTVATTTEDLARFAREVRLMSELNHPNILPVIDSDLGSRTSPWFTMPLADTSLDEIVDELKGDYSRINKIFRQLLQGMAYAHSKSIIHRDIKPANIFLFQNDVVKIGDFGLGKRLEILYDDKLTDTDESLGSFAYSAPEQLESSELVDHRADIYALGKTLFHMITGVLPINAHRDLSRLDARYKSFISRCIMDLPEARYQSVEEMIEAFELVLSEFE